MTETFPIARRSLHGELIPLLRDMVLNGDLRPGEKVHEQGLCVRFGVSRTPLREALKVLASEGLIILTPNRGAMIARISDKEIDELFPIIGALEALAAEAADAVPQRALVVAGAHSAAGQLGRARPVQAVAGGDAVGIDGASGGLAGGRRCAGHPAAASHRRRRHHAGAGAVS